MLFLQQLKLPVSVFLWTSIELRFDMENELNHTDISSVDDKKIAPALLTLTFFIKKIKIN